MRYSSCFKFALVVAFICNLLFLTGCASVKYPVISDEVKGINTLNESIGFLTVRVSNTVTKSVQPKVIWAFIWEDKDENERERYPVKIMDPYSSIKEGFNEYLISFQLKPGKYVFRELFASGNDLWIVGSFIIPLFKKITIPENKVIYLGHIDATIIERNSDDQLRAGPVIPLIGQSLIGASTGTFIINIQDRYETDTAFIRAKYNYMSEVEIHNMTMPEWSKPSKEDMR